MKKPVHVVLILVITLAMVIPVFSTHEIIAKEASKIDNNFLASPDTIYDDENRFIQKLQWYSPNGELPGTYEEYLAVHPLAPASFSTPRNNLLPLGQDKYSFAILVDQTLYPEIETQLNQYLIDLDLEGYVVFMQTLSGGTPEEVKTWVKDRYDTGVQGVVFIGDITSAWAEVSGDSFPSDFFYMDLDGTWEDPDQDGVYENHVDGDGDTAPEVYVCRIYAHTLNYDTEANMVNQYFEKIHAYRSGTLTKPWRGLEYVEEDWYDMDVSLDLVYQENVTRHDYGFFTTAEDYLQQMDLGQHFVQVCVHSYSGGHYFSTRPTESAAYAHVYVNSPTSRPAKLLLGSDDGIKVWLNGDNIYTNNRYGGWSQDRYKINITLQEGWNSLLCKVSQEGGTFLFSARITDMEEHSFDDLAYQTNDPLIHSGEAEYVRSFLLNGFHQDSSDHFWDYLTTNYLGVNEATLNPHAGEQTAGKTWTIYNSGNPYINIGQYCGEADYGVCYAFARITAESEETCQLWMGYDDGARVWLNGNEIVYDNRYGGFEADMKKTDVVLHAGENRLMIKISEWMGDNGFSARFCTPDGGIVEGLSYEPESTLISHIGTWLINGAYANSDKNTRLTIDYLGDEANTTPDEGDPAAYGTWTRGIGEGCPFDLGVFFDHGDWVLSETIQDRDPPVLFYNLFACGPGRFTDEDYLAGAYVFNTTTGLITIASSKSGSMLNFDDFNRPLSEGESIGEAFRDWFIAQAPYSISDKEWFYGMVVIGDPTLCIPSKTQMKIIKPENALYLFNKKMFPLKTPLSIGKITMEVNASNPASSIEKVEFYVDNVLQHTATSQPYEWVWDSPAFFKHQIAIKSYTTFGHNTTKTFTMRKFF